MNGPTPLLDFFKRGEVARDVRLLAAQGVIAPKASEQLAILMVLVSDADPEIRRTADDTLARIPAEALQSFLARSDVGTEVTEFFAARGVFPAGIPAAEGDEPLIDAGPSDSSGLSDSSDSSNASGSSDPDAPDKPDRESVTQRLSSMSFTDRLKAAMKGSREMRALLIRDPNKMIAAAVLSSPKVTHQEVEGFARMANVTEDVLRIIGGNRNWMKNYGVLSGLTRNPKTPIALSLNLLGRLNDRDVSMIAIDRNVPGALRIAARKKALDNVSKK